MATDNIQVAIRVRRLIERELTSGLKSHWTVNENSIICLENDSNGRKIPPYSFDRVFDDSTVTLDIFEEVCKPIVDSALAGFNGTLFAYGQSSSGKTFTMSGSRMQPGIISLAVDEIFTRIENIPDREFLIRIGYLELYKEKVSDLLRTDDTNLKLQEDTDRNIQVVGLTEEVVKDGNSVFTVLKKGDANRHTAETKQNDRSSRSHCILRFVIESRKAGHEDDAVMVSNLYFVDLAGSEKAGDNSGDRFREGCSINKSLFTLGMVIRKLSGDANQQHVSFRDSKLTRILQNALGGNSKTAIICTITPAHVDESDSTLKFASRAKNITNKPTVNEVMSDAAMLKQYRLKMKKLQQQISEMNTNGICMEKAELEKQLEEKDRVEKQQAEMIAKLQEMIVISGSSHMAQEPPKKRRRETWCPGKAKMALHAIPEFSPPDLKSFAAISNRTLEPIIYEDEDSFQLLENIQVPTSTETVARTQNADESINVNPTVKELFQLQDKHEILLNELLAKNNEFKELEEFTRLERVMEAEQIQQLKADLKKKEDEMEALKANLPWLEEELMKAQQERNSLRMKVESMNAKLNSVEDGSGITQVTGQLTRSETQVSDLSNDIQVQKSQYEFHINRLKLKLETYTAMLEEKGVDFETIKTRLSVNDVNESDLLLESQSNDISDLKAKHEEEINELRTEVDMKMIALEKEKERTDELQEQFEIELEKQKEHFLKDIADAKEEIEIYQQMLEEEKSKSEDISDKKQRSASVSDDKIQDIQTKYEDEISRLNLEIQKYRSDCEELKEKSNLNGDDNEQSTVSLLNEDDANEKFVGQIASLQLDVKKYKELYESVHEKMTSRRSQVLDCTVDDESMDINLQFLNGNVQNEMSGGMGMDLQKEMMQVEIDKLRKNHEAEVAELKNEIAKYVSKSEQNELQEGDNLQTDMDKLREDHESEVSELKNEISKYVSILEQNESKEATDLQTELMQAELNKLKENHETEVAELQKEISKYVSMLEQIESKEATDLQTELMQVELNKLKENHETEVAELQKEISKYISMLEQNESKEATDLQTELMQAELNKLKENHETEVAELQKEISKYISMLEQNESKEATDLQTELMQAEVIKMKENHETEVAELREEIAKYVTMLEQNELNAVNLQSEVMQAEIDNVKEGHEIEVAELKEDIARLVEKLEEKEAKQGNNLTETGEDLIDNITEKQEIEVTKLKEEISQYRSMLEQNDVKSETDLQIMRTECDKLKQSHESEVAELKQDIAKYADIVEQNECIQEIDLQKEMMQADIMKMKENHEAEVAELKQEIAKYVGMCEPNECKEEVKVQHEILSTEMNKMRENHENEVAQLKLEIAKYVGLIGQNESPENVDLQIEMMQSEINNLKQNHENEVAKLKEEINGFTHLLDEKSAETDTNVEKNDDGWNKMEVNILTNQFENERKEMQSHIATLSHQLDLAKQKMEDIAKTDDHTKQGMVENNGDDIDLNFECKMAMKEADLERCREEIIELKSKLCSYEELMQQEKEKFGRILECVDERRPHHDEDHDMKTMYEEKINELEDEIKIYMDLLEEGKAKDKGQISKECVSTEVEHVEAKFVEEIDRLKKELEKYSRLSMCGDEQIKENTLLQPIEDITIDYKEENKTLKDQICELQQIHQTEVDGMKKQFETFVEENYETKNSFEEMKKNYEDLVETLKVELEDIKNQLLKLQLNHSKRVKTTCDVKTFNEDENMTEIRDSCDANKLSASIGMVVQQVDMAKDLIDVSMNTSFRESIEKPDTDDIKQLKQELDDKEVCLKELQELYEDAKKMWNEDKKFIDEQEESIKGLKGNIKVLEDRNTELEDHMKALEDELKITYEENTRHISRVEELEGHIRMGKGMLESRDEEIRTLKENIEEIREDLEKEIQEKVQEMESYVSELENKNEANEDALKLANEKIEELEQCEAQFSDKIINLESDVEFLKEKEETLSKMCTDYEEKIVLLEADIDSMKTKTADYERLCVDLEIAQSKHIDLKEVRNQYSEQVQDLVSKLKETEIQSRALESENSKLTERLETLSGDLESVNKNLCKMTEQYQNTEKNKLLMEADIESMKTKTEDYEKLCVDLEIAQSKDKEMKELQHQCNEQIEKLVTKLKETEIQNESLESENIKLTAKLKSLSKDLESVNENLSKIREEYQDIEKEKVELMETQHELEETRKKLQSFEKTLEVIQAEKLSLEEDILVLEKGLPLQVVKYHSQPENIDWENKWEEFTREEKKKRLAVGCTIRRLKKDLASAQEGQKNAYEEALQTVYEKEQGKDVYKKMESRMEEISEEANSLYHDLEEEREKNKTLSEKLMELESGGASQSSQTKVNTMTDDHLCKFKLEAFAAKERMTETQEEFTKRINQYENTISQYEERISHMKNQMRRLQSNMNDTIDVGSMKMPTFDTDRKQEKTPIDNAAINPAASRLSASNLSSANQNSFTNASTNQTSSSDYGSSTSGGIVCYIKGMMTEVENKDLKKEVEKQKRQLSRLDDLVKENKALKQNLDQIKKTYTQSEIEKENIDLKEELKELKSMSKVKESRIDTSLANSSHSRHPLEDMFKLSSDPPPSPRKEALFKKVCTKSQKREDTSRQYPEETPTNCQPS